MGLWLTLARLFRLLIGVSAVSFGWDMHQQIQKGKSWDITWIRPLFRSWLDVYGVTQADLSIQKAPKEVKEGGWVFRARHVHWSGGTIQDIAFHFVWRKGPKLQSLKAKGMNITQWPSIPVSSGRCDLDIQDISLPVNPSLSFLSPLLYSSHERYHLSRSGDQLVVDRSIPNGRSLIRTPWLRAKIIVKNSSYIISGTFQHTLMDLSTGSPLSSSLSKTNSSMAPKAVDTVDSALIPSCLKGAFQGWVLPPSLGSSNLWTWKGECHGKQEGTVAWGAQANRNSVSDMNRDKGWDKGRWHITTSHHSPLKAQWSAHFFNKPVNGSITVGPANLSREHPWSLNIHHAKGDLPIGTWLSLWPNQIPAQQTKVWLTKHFDKGPIKTIDVLIKGLVKPSTSLCLSESTPLTHHAPPQHATEITAPSSKTTPLTKESLPKLQQPPAQPRVHPTTAVPSPSLSLTPSSTPMISVTSLKGGVSLCDLTLNAWDKIPLLQHLDMQADFDLKGVNVNIHRGQFTDHSLQGKVSILWHQHPSILSFETSLKGPLKSLLQVALSLGPKRLAWGIRQAQGTTRTQIKGLIPLEPSSNPIDIDVESKGSGLSAICDTKPWAWHLKHHSMHAHWRQGVLTLSGGGIVNNAPAGWRWADNALTFHARMTLENLKGLFSFWPSWASFGPRASVSGRYTDKDLRVVADLTQCQCRFPGVKNPKKSGSPWSLTYWQTSNQGKLWSKGRWCDLTAHWMESPTQSLAGARLQADKTWAEYQYTNPKKSSPLLLSSKSHQTQRMWDVFTEQGSHRFFLHSDDVLDLRSVFPQKKKPVKSTAPTPAPSLSPSPSHTTRSLPANSVFFDVSMTTPLLYVHTGTFRDVKFRLQGEAPSLIPGDPRSWWSWYTWKEGQIRAIQRTKKAKRPKDGQIVAAISTRNTGQTDVLARVLNVGAVCNGLGLSHRILHGDLICSLQQKKPGSGYHGQLSISNIKIKSSSVGKMLALLSPTLFIDVFSSGIKFYQIDSSFVLKADELTIQKLIARGYNLGAYLKGSITTNSPYPCSLKGVAIPAYFWNAFFRRWPLLGRLLGGNKGIVSSEFVMTGPLTKPVVKIKPFSLLKLGLLKKLFKKRSRPKPASPPSRP